MKKLFILLLMIPIVGFGQKITDQTVQSALSKKYAAATVDEYWENEDGTVEVTTYDKNEVARSVFFDAGLNWIKTESMVGEEDLPAAVAKAVTTAFEDPSYLEIVSVEDKSGSYFSFLLDTGNNTETRLNIGNDGKVIKKEVITYEDDTDW